MEAKEKKIQKINLGVTLKSILERNKRLNKPNSVTSLRQLAAAAEIEYSLVQKVTAGKQDPQWTTLISILDGLGTDILEFAEVYKDLSKARPSAKQIKSQ